MSLKKRILSFFQRLEVKQSLAFSAVLILGLLFTFLAIQYSIFRTLETEDRENLNSHMLSYWAQYQSGNLNELTSQIRNEISEDIVVLLRQNDQLIVSHIPESIYHLRTQLRMYSYDTDGPLELEIHNRTYHFLVDSINLRQDLRLTVALQTDETITLMLHTKKSFWRFFYGIVLFCLITGTGISYLSIRPTQKLNNQIRRITKNTDLTSRLPQKNTGDQLDLLTIQINKFLEQIETLVNGMHHALDNTAHDLRTPLARLRARLETILLEKNPTKEQLTDALVFSLEESEILSKMLSTVLDITEAEKGLLHLEKQKISVGQFLKELIELYEYVGEEKGIAVQLQMMNELFIYVDPVRFRQIIGNLLDNAVKFSPEKSVIKIKVYIGGGFKIISVEDMGPGIPENDLKRIWDRLYRGELSRTTKGTGLGLSVVKALTEAHGGHVGASNIPGGGAVFTISLP